jgi:hypothetical protein
MMPQTHHYVDRWLILYKFEDMLKDNNDFTRIYDVNCWKSIGAEFFSKKWFVPGALFSAHPYQLKDAVALFGFVLNGSNSLATRSTIFFHYNYTTIGSK